MSSELFNESERELIEAARMILSDGVTRLQSRIGLFPTNRARGRSARVEVMEARNALVDNLVATYGALRHEIAAAVLIDAQGRLISVQDFPQGKQTHCEVSPRIMADMIIKSGAVAVILLHNHPSGDNRPSRQDEILTKGFQDWLKFMDVELIDHLVISTGGASSILGEF
jgi:DNA repair protein RadC